MKNVLKVALFLVIVLIGFYKYSEVKKEEKTFNMESVITKKCPIISYEKSRNRINMYDVKLKCFSYDVTLKLLDTEFNKYKRDLIGHQVNISYMKNKRCITSYKDDVLNKKYRVTSLLQCKSVDGESPYNKGSGNGDKVKALRLLKLLR